MADYRWLLILIVFIYSWVIVMSQTITFYTAYRTGFQVDTPSSCGSSEYFDTALLQCTACPQNAIRDDSDRTRCTCLNSSYYYAVNQGGGSLICSPCTTGYTRSTDGFGCVRSPTTCPSGTETSVLSESELNGNPYTSTSSNSQPRIGDTSCITCVSGTRANQTSQRCAPCASITPRTRNPNDGTIECCTAAEIRGGLCLNYITREAGSISTPSFLNRFGIPTTSTFFQKHLETAFYLCRMNLNSSIAQASTRLLLSNVTACHVLANIAAMQFYYPVESYAYYLYENFIWQSSSTQIWNSSTSRPAIPFLAYPSSYYSEINSPSYDWIPATFASKNLVQIKLAKYSTTGQYLNMFDAFDSMLQLCGNGYTDGRPAFTFGTVYNKTCFIRIDSLWTLTEYDTAFYDPYIVFTRSGVQKILPIPVVIRNYRSSTGAPNKDDDESKWVYHRRFFLVDRTSGVTTNDELKNIHYARSIKILFRLVGGTTYIQPPVIIIDYGELSSSDVGKNGVVQVKFESEYRMDLSNHIRDIWIAIAVLCGSGIILALFQTSIWYSRSGKQVIDLLTIGKFFLSYCNVVATSFFIVMAGVSLWWLIFFKRDDTIFFVLPSSTQQASFTALVIVAFLLKTLDILQLIIRQSQIDIFFMDWEKSKTSYQDDVPIWRSCFVANEFQELQTFRRINLTFHLLFVLFFLKVINLEFVAAAQPNTNLFPTSADFQAQYNGILRVGIAFSMWLATALIQYVIYTTFYQYFVENRLANFIDLCSISNTSVFILMESRYGYYIHGRSPHDSAEIDMSTMLLNLQKEANERIGHRGLEPQKDDQTFIIKVSREFRLQYDILLQNYRTRLTSRISKKNEDHESDILLTSYRNFNEFLCQFINRSPGVSNYVIRRRFLLEKLLNREFQRTPNSEPSDSVLFIDPDRNFARCLFVGHENSLFMWNMATFLFVDYFAFNYILAAVITYLLNLGAVRLRSALGRTNLSKKTMIPKNFLI